MDETLKKLIEKETLTEEQIREVILEGLVKSSVAAAETFHALLCTKPHEYVLENVAERSETKCYFYVENQMEDIWKLPDHQTWLRETTKIMEEVGIVLPDELGYFTGELVKAAVGAKAFIMKYPRARELLERVLEID